MGSGLQIFDDTGRLVFDSETHRVLKLYKTFTFPVPYDMVTYDYAVGCFHIHSPGIKVDLHFCMAHGTQIDSNRVMLDQLVVIKDNYISYYSHFLNQNGWNQLSEHPGTVHVMEC